LELRRETIHKSQYYSKEKEWQADVKIRQKIFECYSLDMKNMKILMTRLEDIKDVLWKTILKIFSIHFKKTCSTKDTQEMFAKSKKIRL